MPVAKLTDLEKVRRIRAHKRTRKNLLLLALAAILVFFSVSLVKRAEDVDFATLYSDLKVDLAGNGDGYPVPLPGGKILKLQNAGDNLLLLTDTNLYTYNMSGRQTLNAQHGMSNPLLAHTGDRTLLYDRGGTRYSLYSKSALVHSGSMNFPLYVADISSNENFALVTGSDQSLALVSVYSNPKKEPIFRYWSARMVIDVSLAENQNAMVIACVDVQDGDYLSSISRFQFSIEKEMGRADLPGELILGIDWFNNNTIRVVTDKRAILFDNDLKQIADYNFAGQKLERFFFRPDGGLLVVFGSYAEEKQLKAVLLNSRFKKQGEYTTNYEIVTAKADANRLYIASSNKVEIVSHDGVLLTELPLPNLYKVEPVGDQLFCADNTQISVSSVKQLIAAQEEKDRQEEAERKAKEEEERKEKQEEESSGQSSEEDPAPGPDSSSSSSGMGDSDSEELFQEADGQDGSSQSGADPSLENLSGESGQE